MNIAGKNISEKSLGIVYTPEFITGKIIENVLLYYINFELKKANSTFHGLQEYKSILNLADKPLKNEIVNILANVKILDPACGTGHFLVDLVVHLEQLLIALGKDYKKSDIRTKIISNNIYGLDISSEAIEEVKKRFYTILHNKKITAKSNDLKINFKCNLQIGNYLFTGKSSESLSSGGNAINQITELFPENTKGFDIILGNPPYVRSRNIPSQERELYKQLFQSAWRTFDIYIMFLEHTLKFLKEGQLLSFIIPYSFLQQPYASKARKLLLEQTTLLEIIDLSEDKIFADVTVVTCIITCIKGLFEEPSRHTKFENGIFKEMEELPINTFKASNGAIFKLEMTGETSQLIQKIEEQSLTLDQLVYISKGIEVYERGSGKTKNEFIYNSDKNKIYKKYLEAKELDKYEIIWAKKYLDYQPKVHCSGKFPELFETQKIIMRRIIGDKGITATLDTQGYYVENTLICLVPYFLLYEQLKEENHSLTFYRKFKKGLAEEKVQKSKNYDLRYILGLLNSTVLNYYFKVKLGDKLQIYNDAVQQLPIIRNKQFESEIIALVDQVLLMPIDKNQIMKRLDEYVYKVYNVSIKEKKLIEKFLEK